MKYIWLLLFLVAVAARGQDAPPVNCSGGTMTPDGSHTDCAATPTNPGVTLNNLVETAAWLDSCYGEGAVYYGPVPSTVTGNGECWVSRGITYFCHPDNETQVVVPGTTSAGLYNQFYNRMYDVISLGAGNCPRDGGFHQDFKQCAAEWCVACTKCPNGITYCGKPIQQCPPSPILIPTGKGFNLTSAKDGPPDGFDFSGIGKKIRTAWTAAGSGDAILVCLDCWKGLPPVSEVKDGRYMFGNYTEQTCAPEERNGYCALKEFDKPENGGNGDGIIDWHDKVWPKLKGWIDANHDGISQPNELHTLQELNVCSISLEYSEETHEDEYGNVYHYKALMHRCVGTPVETVDVFFAVDQPTGQAKTQCPLVPRAAKRFVAVDPPLVIGKK
jgi:hypothetical protein